MNDEAPSQGGPDSFPNRLNSFGIRGFYNQRFANGFTIVETLIVLAVTGVLLFMALLVFSGQQSKVEFSQSVRDIQSVIQQTINEVGAGYFPNSNTIQCSLGGSGLNISNGTVNQGSNTDCIFLGKAIQFSVAGSNAKGYNILTIAGVRDNGGSLTQARPKTVQLPNVVVSNQLRNNLTVVSITYANGTVPKTIGEFAFVNGLGTANAAGGGFESGSQQVNLIPVGNSALNDNLAAAAGDIDNYLASGGTISPVNPTGGVKICFASGGTKQSGLITIGGSGRTSSVTLDIKGSMDCS